MKVLLIILAFANVGGIAYLIIIARRLIYLMSSRPSTPEEEGQVIFANLPVDSFETLDGEDRDKRIHNQLAKKIGYAVLKMFPNYNEIRIGNKRFYSVRFKIKETEE